VLADARARAFHSDVIGELANAGLLRLYVLEVAGRAAAAFYGVADRHRWFYYLGGFDPEFARYSIGSLVILHALEQAAASSATEFDFLRGAESYKYRWGAADTRVFEWELTRASTSSSSEAA
jgi:CelD/BcsL family acetyltransferase involved in cellulose biosynthesis